MSKGIQKSVNLQLVVDDARETQITCRHRNAAEPNLMSYDQFTNMLKTAGSLADSMNQSIVKNATPRIATSQYTMVCKACQMPVNMKSYTESEIYGALTVIYDIINQVKIFGNLEEASFKNLTDIERFVDSLPILIKFYSTIMGQLSNNNKGRKNRQNNVNGHISDSIMSSNFRKR